MDWMDLGGVLEADEWVVEVVPYSVQVTQYQLLMVVVILGMAF